MWKLLTILAALIYSLSPVDLLPDYIIGWGWLDDIVVLVILWQVYVRFKERFGASRPRHAPENEKTSQSGPEFKQQASTPRSPREVLGVSPHATLDEIKHAYRQLAAQYHPDKVAHLGEEFRELAEKRFKEIQEAYQELSNQ